MANEHFESINPFEAPSESAVQATSSAEGWPPGPVEYFSPAGRAHAATLVYCLCIAFSCAEGLALAGRISNLESIDRGAAPPLALTQADDQFYALILMTNAVTRLVAFTLFLLWFYRAFKNAGALGARGLRCSPAWSVGYFFVPVLNLFRPFQCASEMWRASDPDQRLVDGFEWRGLDNGRPARAWWTLFLISQLVARIDGYLTQTGTSVEVLLHASYFSLAANALTVALDVSAIYFLRALTRRQQQKESGLRDEAAEA